MIVEFTRGHVRLEIDGRTVTIGGEAYLRGHGSPDFVAEQDTIKTWDDGSTVTDPELEMILADLLASATERGLTFEIE